MNSTSRRFLILLAAIVAAGWVASLQLRPARSADLEAADSDDPTTPEMEARIDAATDKALEYLASIQTPDGWWSSFGKVPAGRADRNASPRSTAITSLAILAFMAKGHQPDEEKYGVALDRGIDFIVRSQLPNGYLSGSGGRMYAHGISTVMLAEVVGQVTGKRQKLVKDALARAVKLILDAQKIPKPPPYMGGWRYEPTSQDYDLSCTGWQLMALRAAKNAGADVPTTAIDDAVGCVKRSAHPQGGFGYGLGGSGLSPAMSGTGVLCMELCGKHLSPEAIQAGDWILRAGVRPYATPFQYYTMYYCSQAMFQLGGHYWKQYWPAAAEEILKRQLPDGSFPLGQAEEAGAGPAYSTAMAVLSLGVRYRLLPIYQR